jgi:drug/metabolite transporter (DMT)-like permease
MKPASMTAPAALPDRSAHGITAMLVAMAMFITNDTLVKLASDALPVGQMMAMRGVVATALVLGLAVVLRRTGHWRALRHPAVLLRTASEVTGTLLYLHALSLMPIANATAILQAMPFIMTILAVVLLGEQVGWRRWSAIGVGFAGVLLVVQPGTDGFSSASWLAIAATVAMSVRDVSSRYLPAAVPTLAVVTLSSAAVTACGFALVLAQGWMPVSTGTWPLILGAAFFVSGGYFFVVLSARIAEISTIAPFRYTILLWAFLYGWLIWGELPNAMALVGIALIVASGLYVFERERVKGR